MSGSFSRHYIDKAGKFIISPIYSWANDFSDGVAWVQEENQPPMLIDKKGKMILQIDSLKYAGNFNNGIAKIGVLSQEKGLIEKFINKNGEEAIITTGEHMGDFSDGLYSFNNAETGKWGYKNQNGEIVINEQFDYADEFSDGMAIIRNDVKFGVIDKKGNYLINPQYEYMEYDSVGLFVVELGEKYGWINKKGETVINPQFDAASSFDGNKLAPVRIGSKSGYINKNGEIAINPQFDEVDNFRGNYAKVVNNDKLGFIDQKGNFVMQCIYDYDYWQIFGDILYEMRSPEHISYEHIRFILPEQFVLPYEQLEKREKSYFEAERKRNTSDFKGSRDGKEYKSVKIGKQVWMAENLNYEAKGSKCHSNNCDVYGRLYNWATVMALDQNCSSKSCASQIQSKHKGICPDGWHIPSDADWDTLMTAVGGASTAGTKLKATSGWNSNGNGTDIYGFSALPSGHGYSDGSFDYVGSRGYWWSSTEFNHNGKYAHYRYMRYDSENAQLIRNGPKTTYLFNARCLQD
ncbi:MAG: WG repeat-containing protein [Fibromonadales bacterium]|nr:WG repeat-containing protein [Fibromonadales bacterium]